MRKFYFLVSLLFAAFGAGAQQPGTHEAGNPIHGTHMRSSGASGTGANIDVDNYQIWWRINPDSSKGIKGVVKTKFRTTVANVSTIALDLSSLLVIDEIIFRGISIKAGATRSGDILSMSLGTTIPTIGKRDSITISYHGIPQDGTPAGGGIGYRQASDPARSATYVSNNSLPAYRETTGAGNYIYTLAESFEDRDWWPCKADMQDKADTIDITVNVPWKLSSTTDTFWVATNGRLVDSTINTVEKSRTFVYQNRYPMATYLVSVCVAKYNRYYRGTTNIGGFNVPVVYYLFPGKATYSAILTAMDKATELVAAFSNKFGNYAFADPVRGGKHGFYEGLGTFGGMEHQTFSGISTNSLANYSLLAHELSHQWWGDKVTFSTWSDLWLAEGFAAYAESLAPELVSGMGYSAASNRSTNKANALADINTSVSIPPANATNSDQIWLTDYGSTIYNRGGVVVSMLRLLAGDTKFFQALTNYMTDPTLAYKSATTTDLRKHFKALIDIGPDSLTEFFNDNINGTGNPVHNLSAVIYGNQVKVKRSLQTRTGGSGVAYFNQPIELWAKKTSPAQQAALRFYDRGDSLFMITDNGFQRAMQFKDSIVFTIGFVPTAVTFDDSSRVMATSSLNVSVVNLNILDFAGRTNKTVNQLFLTIDENEMNTGITLQRSADGIRFNDLGLMTLSAGGATKKYKYDDFSAPAGDNFYRASLQNAQGNLSYSKTVKLNSANKAKYEIAENPVKSILTVKMPAGSTGNHKFEIFDAAAKRVSTYTANSLQSREEINVSRLAPGVYFLRIADASGSTDQIEFLKQ